MKHLDRAIEAASSSLCRARHSTVIARGHTVLAVAVNSDRNSPHVCSDPKTQAARHSEWNALRKVRDMDIDMRKVTVYNARVLKDGTPALAKPCPRCAYLLDFYDVGRVVWTE